MITTIAYIAAFGLLVVAGILFARDRARKKEAEYSDESPVRKKHAQIEYDLARLRDILKDNPELEISEIEYLFSVSYDTACFYVERLMEEGYMERIDHSGRYIYYPRNNGEGEIQER